MSIKAIIVPNHLIFTYYNWLFLKGIFVANHPISIFYVVFCIRRSYFRNLVMHYFIHLIIFVFVIGKKLSLRNVKLGVDPSDGRMDGWMVALALTCLGVATCLQRQRYTGKLILSYLFRCLVLSADFCYCTKDVFSTAIEADAYLSPVSAEQFPESEAQQLLHAITTIRLMDKQ